MSKPKIKPPPVPAPQAIPQVAPETEDEAMKRVRSQSGFEKTILTGSLSPKPTKKTVMG